MSYVLSNAGTIGTAKLDEQDELELTAYFSEMPSLAELERDCRRALVVAELPADGLKRVTMEVVEPQDWLTKWKENYRPFAVGERFLIAPSWLVPDDVGGRILIIIDPGMAFGTGTHETTQACLTAIERYWSGRSLLDVGTGTGILAMAAAKLSSVAGIMALDLDPDALQVARENVLLNGVADRITLIEGTIDQVTSEFEMVVANLTTDVHLKLIRGCSRLVENQGILGLSGILSDDEPIIAQALAESGFKTIEVIRDGEWLAFVAERAD